MSNTIAIEVAYALPDKQRIIKLDVPEGTTVVAVGLKNTRTGDTLIVRWVGG